MYIIPKMRESMPYLDVKKHTLFLTAVSRRLEF